MKTLKTYGPLFMFSVSCFMYGAYCERTLNGGHIEIHRWFLTGFFGLFFLLLFIQNIKK